MSATGTNPRVAKLSGSITWAGGDNFFGYAVCGIVLPPTHSYPVIACQNRYSTQRIPQWSVIPIQNGSFTNGGGLIYNDDIVPLNTSYVIYYYDESMTLIGAPSTTSDYFYANAGTITPPVYTLTPPALNLDIPVPNTTSQGYSEVVVKRRHYTVDYAAPLFATDATTIQIPIFDLPARAKIWALEVILTSAFAGTGVTSATLTVGDGSDNQFYMYEEIDCMDTPAADNFTDVSMYKAPSQNASTMYAVFTFNVNAGDGDTTILTSGAVRVTITYTENG